MEDLIAEVVRSKADDCATVVHTITRGKLENIPSNRPVVDGNPSTWYEFFHKQMETLANSVREIVEKANPDV